MNIHLYHILNNVYHILYNYHSQNNSHFSILLQFMDQCHCYYNLKKSYMLHHPIHHKNLHILHIIILDMVDLLDDQSNSWAIN